jgi:AraC-like DNA-binding protein
LSKSSQDNTEHFNRSVSIFHLQGSVVAEPFFQLGGTSMALVRRPEYECKSHISDCHRVILILQGEMEFQINDQSFIAKPKDIVITPVNSKTKRKTIGTTEWIYLDINDSLFWKPLREIKEYHRAYESFDIMAPLVTNIIDALRSNDHFTLRCAHENSEMLVTLLKREIWNDGEPSRNHLEDTVLELVEQVKNHPEKEWYRPSLAKSAHMSERNLTRTFVKVFGVPPAKMILRIRMEKAMTALREDQHSIEQIGHSVGYESLVSFSRAFKTYLGISPSSYRTKALES